MSLADYFDALTSKRSYKKAYAFDRSISMALEEAGNYFDPTVVMAFMRNKERIKSVWEANRDIEEFLKSKRIKEETFF